LTLPAANLRFSNGTGPPGRELAASRLASPAASTTSWPRIRQFLTFSYRFRAGEPTAPPRLAIETFGQLFFLARRLFSQAALLASSGASPHGLPLVLLGVLWLKLQGKILQLDGAAVRINCEEWAVSPAHFVLAIYWAIGFTCFRGCGLL